MRSDESIEENSKRENMQVMISVKKKTKKNLDLSSLHSKQLGSNKPGQIV